MKKQKGRPAIEESRKLTEKITIMLTKEEKAMVKNSAQMQHMSVSQYVRTLIIMIQKFNKD